MNTHFFNCGTKVSIIFGLTQIFFNFFYIKIKISVLDKPTKKMLSNLNANFISKKIAKLMKINTLYNINLLLQYK